MTSMWPDRARTAASTFAIGDPGRAAREMPAGPPGDWFGVADTELSAASLPGVLVRAATVRGLHHRAVGGPRQDAYALGRYVCARQAERMIAVVCDGVGSLGRSAEAAALVSRDLARSGANGVPWPKAFAEANDALRELAEAALSGESVDPRADGMATTAVALSVWRENDDWVGQVAWVGDSTVWHLDGDGTWTLLSGTADADDGVHSTAASALPSADGSCHSADLRAGGGALFAMTDGVANPLRWSTAVRLTLAEWWASPPAPHMFAAQVGFARKTHIDDRTVVGIWADRDLVAGELDPSAERTGSQETGDADGGRAPGAGDGPGDDEDLRTGSGEADLLG